MFSDVGPPDLCNFHKQLATSKRPDFGTFLYFTGVDTSNSASIAAHLQGLANLVTSRAQYWFGEKKHFKVPELTYCSYNAFSNVDMRVTVHIPGKFECAVVSSDGKLIQDRLSDSQMDRLWLETFVCSVVRCMLDGGDDDDANKVGALVEIRRENPFNNGVVSQELLVNFVTAFETLFWEGAKLGCGVELPQPTLILNYLVDGFLRCVQLTQSWDLALSVLERLERQEPSVATLIAQVLLFKDEEIRAVQVLSDAIARDKRDLELLLLQTRFLVEKRRYDLALHMAKQAVNSSPSDFKTWAALVSVYTKLNDFENALLTLNSCPMNSHKEAFSLKRVVPIRHSAEELHLPSPVDVTLEDVSNLLSAVIIAEQKALDPQLANLPAGNLKSTFAKAYDLLTEIVNRTGWEALLKHRAKVFVMEEEYRKDRSSTTHTRTASEVNVGDISAEVSSTTAIKSPRPEAASSEGAKPSDEASATKQSAGGPSEGAKPDGVPSDEATGSKPTADGPSDEATEEATESSNPDAPSSAKASAGSSAPAPAALDSRNGNGTALDTTDLDSEFRKKRLCERWLDNLFMLLYEDLRAYTMWQAEFVHFQAQQMEYKKTALEWEILGQIAFRLKHYKEGSVAFSRALGGRFASKAQREMLRNYEMERSKVMARYSATDVSASVAHSYTRTINQLNEKILEATIKLLVWNHRWYNDFSPALTNILLDLVAKEGLIKIQSVVQAVYSDGPGATGAKESTTDELPNHGVVDMMEEFYRFCKEYHVNGCEN